MDENRIKTQNSPFPLPVVPMQSANVNQTNESKNQWLIDETRLRAVVLFSRIILAAPLAACASQFDLLALKKKI